MQGFWSGLEYLWSVCVCDRVCMWGCACIKYDWTFGLLLFRKVMFCLVNYLFYNVLYEYFFCQYVLAFYLWMIKTDHQDFESKKGFEPVHSSTCTGWETKRKICGNVLINLKIAKLQWEVLEICVILHEWNECWKLILLLHNMHASIWCHKCHNWIHSYATNIPNNE
jgi:hypothetical protein